jgi:two-component system response regulator HupR/HoxA
VTEAPSPAVPFDPATVRAVHALCYQNRPGEAIRLLETLEPRTREERAEVHLHRGYAEYLLGNLAQSRIENIRALRLTAPCSDFRVMIRHNLVTVLRKTGQTRRAIAQANRCLADAMHAGCSDSRLAAIHNMLGKIHRMAGHMSEAIACFERGRGLAREATRIATRNNFVIALLYLAESYLQLDRPEEARAALGGPDPFRSGEVAARYTADRETVAAWLDVIEGHLGSAEARIEAWKAASILQEPDSQRLQTLVEVEWALAAGHGERALQILEPVWTRIGTHGFSTEHDLWFARLYAEVLLGAERARESLEAARIATALAPGISAADEAAAFRVAGCAARALGDREQADRCFEDARRVLEGTELARERRLLDQARANGSGRAVVRAAALQPTVREPQQLVLKDGRVLLSQDPHLVAAIRFAARDDIPVVIEGETGTGKELVAHLMHELSPLAEGPFVIVDCTTLAEDLAEAELFGSVRGSYTGALRDRTGLLGEAHNGTVFLDELSELSQRIQAKLLRTLQEGVYRRLGETQWRACKARFVAASNRPLQGLVSQGALKPDLYFRLLGHRIRLSPLRERPEEITLLATTYARSAGSLGITARALSLLRAQEWPGNVRELQTVVRLAVSRCGPGRWLDAEHFDRGSSSSPGPVSAESDLRAVRLNAERQTLERLLLKHGGNVRMAAAEIGISRQALYKALKRVHLP